MRPRRAEPPTAGSGVEPPLGHRHRGIGDERARRDRTSPVEARRSGRRRSPGPRGPDRRPSGTRARRGGPPRRRRPLAASTRPHRPTSRTASRTPRASRLEPLRSRVAACVAGGVAMATAVAPSSASASSNAVRACGTSSCSARRAVRSAFRPTSASTSNPAARSAGTCTRHPNPVPTTTAPSGATAPRPGQ